MQKSAETWPEGPVYLKFWPKIFLCHKTKNWRFYPKTPPPQKKTPLFLGGSTVKCQLSGGLFNMDWGNKVISVKYFCITRVEEVFSSKKYCAHIFFPERSTLFGVGLFFLQLFFFWVNPKELIHDNSSDAK